MVECIGGSKAVSVVATSDRKLTSGLASDRYGRRDQPYAPRERAHRVFNDQQHFHSQQISRHAASHSVKTHGFTSFKYDAATAPCHLFLTCAP